MVSLIIYCRYLPIIFPSNTVVKPNAMVIENFDTSIAFSTVLGFVADPRLAYGAVMLE